MKEFLENIIKQIVEEPEAVIVTEEENSGRINLTIKVADGDMGRVIGKEGKVINAIRMIMRVMAIRQNVRVRVDIEDARQQSDDQGYDEPVEQSVEVEPVMQEEIAPMPEQAPSAADFVGQPSDTTLIDNSGN